MTVRDSWMRAAVVAGALVAVGLGTAYLLTEESHADDYASVGVGIFDSGKDSSVESKFINIGHRDALGLGLTYQYELGGWTDVAGNGRTGSAYGAFQLGVETDQAVFARVMFGPALITNHDVYLGGIFQLTEDLYVGLRGQNGNAIGVKYKHISSAGLEQPNNGRDFAGIEASIPF